MTKKRQELKILLIQIRSDDSQPHEVKAILKHAHLNKNQVTIHDALTKPVTPDLASGFDAVIVGGSGECNVSKNQPANINELEIAVRSWINNNIPYFGICYGGHLLAQALGGKVEHTPEKKELGNTFLFLNDAAKADDLFKDLPNKFAIGVGHTDSIAQLPKIAISLANTEIIQHHAFKIKDKLAYGVQFHPELDKLEHQERMRSVIANSDKYYKDEADMQHRMDALLPTPESSSLLKRFIDLVIERN